MSQKPAESIGQKWQMAWKSGAYRAKFFAGCGLLLAVLAFFPVYFQWIEAKEGKVLNDWLLDRLPAYNVSIPIFLSIWAVTLLMVIRSLLDPDMLLAFLWAYVLLCLARIISISLVPLNPPENLLPLIDPITNTFYGHSFVTKDLFFSGHTATTFLMFLCFKDRADKIFSGLASLLIGLLLLIQHVHYSIDVLAAPLFAYLVYLGGIRITRRPAGQQA